MEYIYDDKNHKKEIYNLYQEVFEDPKPFADYYFDEVYAQNKVLMARKEEQIVGTIHLNPYEMKVKDEDMLLHYIVAVATKAECRRQGVMRGMLEKVLCDMAKNGEPFTYLEPADKAYYEPFDFVFAMDWKKDEFYGDARGMDSIVINFDWSLDYKRVVSYIEEQLAGYDVKPKMTEAYLKRIQKEAMSQDGDIMVCVRDGKIQGIFAYGKEDDTIYVRFLITDREDLLYPVLRGYFKGYHVEVMNDERGQGEVIPSIMVRIANLEKMISLIQSKKKIHKIVRIEDSVIGDNDGVFELTITEERGEVKRTNQEPEFTISIGELAQVLFGAKRKEELQEIIPVGAMYITEEV